MKKTLPKTLVAMSGGVDSSVAALLLKEEGRDVVGVAMHLVSCHRTTEKSCCSAADRLDAQMVCNRLGIPFHSLDYREEFKQQVIQPFVAEYAKGRTPIPCVSCNVKLKFSALFEDMHRMNASKVATGHYARIQENEGRYTLHCGVDGGKDQTYYLFHLSQNELKSIEFPLGNLHKTEVRAMARSFGLETSDKPDSQEICFVTKGSYVDFLEEFDPDSLGTAGAFVDSAGNILGRHEGIHAYTIGQRRGLGISTGKKMYVQEIRVESNEVVLGNEDDLLRDTMIVDEVNWTNAPVSRFASEELKKQFGKAANGDGSSYMGRTIQVKIRAKHQAADASLTQTGDNQLSVRFHEPQSAITPGQAAVFYDGDEVLGGGWIR